ncbi:metal-binding protein ZinT (plasmid) [Paracoccus methylovorus]|uniref:Metal-binding protein ZinT n=1 Tax=Paracoccus methylovorus TaxID=2812658 RepID=A0ABX7JSD9_9RHOB|nr:MULTISPECIES: metal-binding protein ZinT [Paracoccus]QRZ16158.1 metal-binding protein ZinT [Paracoccus methylovorus]
MQNIKLQRLGALVFALALGASGVSAHETGATAAEGHDHSHSHSHDHDAKGSISEGYFENEQVKPRELSDWAGNWQSVYPYLQDGTLDGVMAHKAEHGDKTAEEYRAYYETGYKTDTNRIVIEGDRVEFSDADSTVAGQYQSDGHEILTYEKGNRGVRYVFRKVSGDEAAPAFIQFSDHIIAPAKSGHYHLYWGDDRQVLLEEVTHWPTYYPADLTGEQVAKEMLAH